MADYSLRNLKRTVVSSCLLGAMASSVPGQYLFEGYIDPGFGGNAVYAGWNVFYSANEEPNFPSSAAPFGTFGPASAAGFSDPTGSAWNPVDPLAFWDNRNPTVTNVTGGAFLISPGFAGNIYSFSEALEFEIEHSVDEPLESVLLQFQTAGTAVDFESIRLEYQNGSGVTSRAASEWVREFRGSGSSFGGNSNRNALEWDLSGLGVTDYKIVFEAAGSSLSLQEVLLDTTDTFASAVPSAGFFEGTVGNGWTESGNWRDNRTPESRGNLWIEGGGQLDLGSEEREVGLVGFRGANDFQIFGDGDLTVNTGFSVSGSGYQHEVLNDLKTGGIQVVSVDAGSELILSGAIRGNFGFEKSGEGWLVLSGDNTFSGSLGILGGGIRIEGGNAGLGGVSILRGDLEIVAGGDIGTGGTAVNLGADSSIFEFSDSLGATLRLNGDVALSRGIVVAQGTFEKSIRAVNTIGGARMDGDLRFPGTGSDLEIGVEGSDGLLELGGDLDMPIASRIIKRGAGTFVFSGGGGTRGSFDVMEGFFRVADSGSMTTTGSWTVAAGSKMGGGGEIGLAGGESIRLAGDLVVDGKAGGLRLGLQNDTRLIGEVGGSFLFDFREGNVALTFGAVGPWIEGWENLSIHLLLPDDFNYDIARTLFENVVLANPGAIGGITGFDQKGYAASLSASGGNLILGFTAIPEVGSLGLSVGLVLGWTLLRRRGRRT